MTDLARADQEWRGWIERVASAVGVDPALVSVPEIHALTSAVAADFTRPMAPVSAYIWGLAQATRPDADPDALRRAILASMPS